MRVTLQLLTNLRRDFPAITFQSGDVFYWNPDRATVGYDESDTNGAFQLFHELAHGLLNHQAFERDIELLAMERAAWTRAREVARNYDISISDDVVEDALDSYRDWLHARSTCPQCDSSGIEADKHTYSCPACSHRWTVNDARRCGLKRTTTK